MIDCLFLERTCAKGCAVERGQVPFDKELCVVDIASCLSQHGVKRGLPS